MTVGHFVKQAENNAWANGVLYAALAELSPEAYGSPYPSFFGSIPATLNHIYGRDLYYLDALTEGGKGRSVYDREDVHDPRDLGQLQAGQDAGFVAFCEGLSEDDLTRTVPTERPGGMTSERIDWLILHLIQHQIHHRGQVHAMISQAGGHPPQLDDFYLDHGRAAGAEPYWQGT